MLMQFYSVVKLNDHDMPDLESNDKFEQGLFMLKINFTMLLK